MKPILLLIPILILLQSCTEQERVSSVNPVNWSRKTIDYLLSDSLIAGTTYLSVYSEIYSQTEHRTHSLTATVSMRNVNLKDTVFVEKATYFDTKGHAIRTYFDRAIFIAPMETVEIVIDELDIEGGTGANFLFEWKIRPNSAEPLFEGVMISTSGQQGLSFTTQGHTINTVSK
jgi:hypothetical protein